MFDDVQDEQVQPEASSIGELSSNASQLEVNDAQVQLMEQEKMLQHLKEMVREREQSLAQKDAELQVCSLCTSIMFALALQQILSTRIIMTCD